MSPKASSAVAKASRICSRSPASALRTITSPPSVSSSLDAEDPLARRVVMAVTIDMRFPVLAFRDAAAACQHDFGVDRLQEVLGHLQTDVAESAGDDVDAVRLQASRRRPARPDRSPSRSAPSGGRRGRPRPDRTTRPAASCRSRSRLLSVTSAGPEPVPGEVDVLARDGRVFLRDDAAQAERRRLPGRQHLLARDVQ